MPGYPKLSPVLSATVMTTLLGALALPGTALADIELSNNSSNSYGKVTAIQNEYGKDVLVKTDVEVGELEKMQDTLKEQTRQIEELKRTAKEQERDLDNLRKQVEELKRNSGSSSSSSNSEISNLKRELSDQDRTIDQLKRTVEDLSRKVK
ncbi:TPA: hypothetical protein SAN82_001228 [Pseudomonas putida]|nr:hypothetical protein [Pseudomonas putida]